MGIRRRKADSCQSGRATLVLAAILSVLAAWHPAPVHFFGFRRGSGPDRHVVGHQARMELLSPSYVWESPFRHFGGWLRRAFKHKDEAARSAGSIEYARDLQITGTLAGRAKAAMNGTCRVLRCLGIEEARECPEVIVSAIRSGGISGYDSAWITSTGSASGWPSVAPSAVVIDPGLLHEMRNDELQALFGLLFGRHLLQPAVSSFSWAAPAWMAARAAWYWRRQELQPEMQAVLVHAGLLHPHQGFFHKRSDGNEWHAVRRLASEASIVSLASQGWALRTDMRSTAAVRLAAVAGGSPHSVISAMSKTKDAWLSKRHVGELYSWAESPHGSQLLDRTRLCHEESSVSRELEVVGPAVLLLLVLCALTASRLGVQAASTGIAASLAAAACVCSWRSHTWSPEIALAFLFAASFYLLAVALTCSRCSLQHLATLRAEVDTLQQQVLPQSAEAAAGISLLARSASTARQIPLGQMDNDLRTRWATALRGLSAKLADLRRLAGATISNYEMQESSPARAWPLCNKLENEIKRVLVGETLWMRRVLELEQDAALERALFWWLYEDGEGGFAGSPRLTVPAEQVEEWVSTHTLDKLKVPTLSSTLASEELQRLPPAKDMAMLQSAADAMQEQHQQLDNLMAALQRTSPPSVGKARPNLRSAWQAGSSLSQVEQAVQEFLDACNSHDILADTWGHPFAALRLPGMPDSGVWRSSGSSDGSDLCWCLQAAAVVLGLLGVLAAVALACAEGRGMWLAPEVAAFVLMTYVLLWHHWSLRLPRNWASLQQRLVTMATRRHQAALQLRLEDKGYSERLAHLKALVLVQGVQTAQNLDYLTLCVQAEALRNAAAKCDAYGQRLVPPVGRMRRGSPRDPPGRPNPSEGPEEFTCHCLQLLLAVLPRQGTQGRRLVSSDMDIRNAMEWFEHVSRTNDLRPPGRFSWAAEDTPAMAAKRRESLQESLATGQRCLWMMYRLCDAKASAKPTTLQGALAALMTAQLGPIVLEHRLRIPVYDPTSAVHRPSQEIDPSGFMAERRSPGFSEESGRILGDLDSTTGSNDDASVDSSSQASGTVRRILQPSEGGQSSVGSKSSGGAQRVLADLDGDSDASSVVSGIEGDGGPNRRILAASDTSDASSESASSAGQGSFALPSSMWSGITYSAASSASTVTEDLLTHRRPLLEGYAHALRPLFMTRGDVTHLLSKFPQQVLLGGVNTARNFAAHRELLEELFGSLVVWVKTPERRGRIRLAFGCSFRYAEEPYMLGSVMTTLLFVGDGVQRTGNEACPVVHEENEEEEWAASECAASAARDDATTQEQSVLEFEEVVVPLTEISSRELFLAELLQSDQCQLLASLSQGSHSKYGHRALRRRRRTLRHVREATQLLVSVPQDG